MKTWTLVTAIVDELPDDWAILAEAFREHGIEGTVISDSPPSLSGYLYDATKIDPLIGSLRAAGAASVTEEEIEEVDWAESWKQFFKPRRIGNKFIIRPTWEPFELHDDDIEIVLDPGQSFGTGDHPTTRMCLELIELAGIADCKVADIGCGSGILTIAMAKLGAKSIVAVDTEEKAVEAAKENLIRNQCTASVLVGKGFSAIDENENFDLVVSNIISAAIIALAPDTSNRVRSNGRWIVSGIIEDNWNDVSAAVIRNGFRIVEVKREDGWVAAMLCR